MSKASAPKNPGPAISPHWNSMSPGFTLPLIEAALDSSGYPFQTRVAAMLTKWFHVQEEWPFLDRTTGQLRTMDILAGRRLWNPSIRSHWSPLRPTVQVLAECKSSRSPWVFVRAIGEAQLGEFPRMTGLPIDEITVDPPGSGGVYVLSPQQLLELHEQPFVRAVPHVASSFTKAVRKGGDAELSGSEPFLSVVEPLIGAMKHYQMAVAPRPTWVNFEPALVNALFITDAPLIVATITKSGRSTEIVPWVRLIRHEFEDRQIPVESVRHWPIDCVHVDYLSAYLTEHLLPFARFAARRIRARPYPLMTGYGLLSGSAGRYEFTRLKEDPSHPFDQDGEDHRIVIGPLL